MRSKNKTKKADSKTDDFFMEIKISKNSLPNSSELQAATGSLRGFLRAAKIAACPSKKQPLAGSATPTPRVVANIKDIQDSINIFDEKIKNWEKSPITDEYAFLLYVLTKLPHETSKNQSYYVIEENGNFRIRFSFHNAVAKYLNKNVKYKIGITFQSKDTPITFEPTYNVYYKEHVYYTEYLASEVLCDILQGIVNVLKGGYYTIPCDLPLYSPTKEKYIEHFGENYEKVASNAPDQSAPLSGTKIAYDYERESGKMFNADTMSLEGIFHYDGLKTPNEIYEALSEHTQWSNGAYNLISALESYYGGELIATSQGAKHAIETGLVPIPATAGRGVEYHHLAFQNSNGEYWVESVPFEDAANLENMGILFGLQGTKKAGTNPATRIALAITIEKIPTADHSGRQPQGEYTPYKNCQPASSTHTVGDLFGCEDIKISIYNLKKLLKNWTIEDASAFVLIVSNNIGAEPSVEMIRKTQNEEPDDEKKTTISYYLDLPQYSLRIGLHNLNAKNYKGERNRPENHAVTFKNPLDEDIFKPHKGVNVKEYVYVYWTKERLEKVARAILNLLQTGVWDNSIAEPDYTNPKTDQSAPLSGIGQTVSPTFAFAKELAKLYANGQKLDFSKAKSINANYQLSDNALMQACELGLVLQARNIAQGGGTIRERYDQLVDLYARQITIQPKDSVGKSLQQYSTPSPFAFLLGEWVKNGCEKFPINLYYEPTAGNGLLTIALPPNRTIVNELDKPRYENLQLLGFHRVLNKDAASIEDGIYTGVIMNPPFDSLDKTDYLRCNGTISGRGEVEYVFERLDHKIAITALSMMRDTGRAAIIVGGKIAAKYADYESVYWKNGALFGSWRTFITYLHRQYRIADVIYINGDLYRKQGTTYPIVVILIDGRTDWNADIKHQWHTFNEQLDSQIDTFNEFWLRMRQHFDSAVAPQPNTDHAERLATAKITAHKLFLYAETMKCNLDGTADYAKYQEFIKRALKTRITGKLDCTELVSEYNRKKVNRLLDRNITHFFLSANDLRHIKNRHGKGKENNVGQLPITDVDLQRIPEILAEPTRIELGSLDYRNGQGVKFIKTYPDGSQYCVLVDSCSKGELTLKTGYKKTLNGLSSDFTLYPIDDIKSPKTTSVTHKRPRRFEAKIVNFFKVR